MLLKISSLISSLLIISCTSSKPNKPAPKWVGEMNKQIQLLEKKHSTEFGVFVKRLSDQSTFKYKADQYWYLSSTVKIPVAIALLKLVDQNKLKLTDKVTIQKSHYRDGAGPTNWIKPGKQVTYKYLLDKMLIYSDNAATDLIIKKVGIDSVNNYVKKYTGGKAFGTVTSLLDVRKIAYSNFHPKAKDLSNLEYFEVKKQKGAENKLNKLASLLKVKRSSFKYNDLSSGFNKYYADKWNSAPLSSYAILLEKIINGETLSLESTAILKATLIKVKTGKNRIRKGLNKGTFFAHKTGTQHKQACDVGYAGNKTDYKAQILILVCTKNWKKLSHGEKVMAEVSKIISKQKLFSK